MINRKAAITIIVLVASVFVSPAQTIWDTLAIERDSLQDLQINELQREQFLLKRDLARTRKQQEQRSDSLFNWNIELDAELDDLRNEKEKLSQTLSQVHQGLQDAKNESESYRLKLRRILWISELVILFLLILVIILLFYMNRKTRRTSNEEIQAFRRKMKDELTVSKDEIREEIKRDLELFSQEIEEKARKQIRKNRKTESKRIRRSIRKDLKSEIHKRIAKLRKMKKARKKK